jgi:hypothetical protein
LYFLAGKGVLVWVRIQRAAWAAMHATNLASEPPFSHPFFVSVFRSLLSQYLFSNPLYFISNQQCFGSMTFLYGSVDPDPDPVLFVEGLQDGITK